MFSSALKSLQGSENEQQYLSIVEPDAVTGEDNYLRQPINSYKHYFEIRISDIFLKQKRKFWREYAPLIVFKLRFLKSGASVEIPFILNGNKLLDQQVEESSTWTDLQNIPVINATPYEGGNVELTYALYALECRDYAGELFDIADQLLSSMQSSLISDALRFAATMNSVISKITNLKKIQKKIGVYQSFDADINSPFAFKDQYILKVNANHNMVVNSGVVVQGGRLFKKSGSPNGERYTDHDYCLLRIKSTDQTNYAGLPCFEFWNECLRFHSEANSALASIAFDEFLRQVAVSPDLTEHDRSIIPMLYTAKLQDQLASHEQQHEQHFVSSNGEELQKLPVFRGDSTITAGINYRASELKNLNRSPEIYTGLKKIADNWKNIASTEESQNNLEFNTSLTKQIAAVEQTIGQIQLKPIDIVRELV